MTMQLLFQSHFLFLNFCWRCIVVSKIQMIVHVNSDAYKSLLCWSTTCLQTLNCNTYWTCIYLSYILLLPHKPPPSSPCTTHSCHPSPLTLIHHTSLLVKHHPPLLSHFTCSPIILHSPSFPTTLSSQTSSAPESDTAV